MYRRRRESFLHGGKANPVGTGRKAECGEFSWLEQWHRPFISSMGEQNVGLWTWKLRGSCTGCTDSGGEGDSELHATWGKDTGCAGIAWQAREVATSPAGGVP